MSTDSIIRDFLLDPAMAGTLSVPLDQFVIHTTEGDVSFPAHLTTQSNKKGFELEVRDLEARDIAKFFKRKSFYTQDDGIPAEGWFDARFPILIPHLYSPASTNRSLGTLSSSRATFRFRRLRIPPIESDHRPFDDAESEGNPASVPYSHFAIFQNTKLKMVNGGVKETRVHSFLPENTQENEETWIGEALEGEYCLHQRGDHLELHFRHHDSSDSNAVDTFTCLISAVAMIHAIFPWPTYRQHRRNGTLLDRELALHGPIRQGSIELFRKHNTYNNPTAGRLLTSLAALFHSSPVSRSNKLKRLLWVMQGTDSNSSPFPTQLMGVCTVLEGLMEIVSGTKPTPPDEFDSLKSKALEWVTNEHHDNPYSKRLIGYLKNWNYLDRKTTWCEAFTPLFPGKEDWLNELFKIYNAYRHGLAHGNFDKILKDDSQSDFEALNRLTGLVNLTMAALSGFEGEMLEAPFSDQKFQINHQSKIIAR